MKMTRFFFVFLLSLCILLQPMPAGAQAPIVLTVNSTGDTADAAPGDGVCLASGGGCTLRAAIQEADFHSNAHEIRFNLPGSGARMIQPLTPLPRLYNNTSVIGPNGDGAAVVLDGSAAGDNASGLACDSSGGVTIKGMRIQNFSRAGVFTVCQGGATIGGPTAQERNVLINNQTGVELYVGSRNITITGNFIGIDSTNVVRSNGNGIVIGSLNTGITNVNIYDNVISGNTLRGIYIFNQYESLMWIEGNFIGTDIYGTAARPNGREGIQIDQSSSIYIGSASDGNIISGNGSYGIFLRDSNGILIQGNLMGTDATQAVYLRNSRVDILVEGGEEITIGGDTTAQGNTLLGGVVIQGSTSYSPAKIKIKLNWIGSTSGGVTRAEDTGHGLRLIETSQSEVSFNKITHFEKGIVIDSNSGILLSKNRVWNNAGIGIDLKNDGPTPNDPLDADSGPNGLQNYPRINPVVVKGGPIYFADLSGTLDSKPNTDYTIEIFTSQRCDASGYGEGETYYGNAAVKTDAAGTAVWSKNDILLAGKATCFTATAREDSSTNTSEFSPGVLAIAGPKIYLPVAVR